jgi:hypothetical protein
MFPLRNGIARSPPPPVCAEAECFGNNTVDVDHRRQKMKKVTLLFFLILILIASSAVAQNKYIFSVKPGDMISSASFGFQMGRWVPFVGMDLVRLGASTTFTDDDYYSYDSGGDLYETRDVNKDKLSGSALLLMPQLGVKRYMGSGDVKSYLVGGILHSIPFVNAKSESRDEHWEYENGVLTDHEIDVTKDELGKEAKDLLQDVLGFWGVTLGGGAEYFFGERFSVGGEYGIRLLFLSTKFTDEDRDDYGNEEYIDKYTTEISSNLSLTYGLLTLSYHF